MEYKDISINDRFVFRFIKEDNEWVCKMPTWLIELAEQTFKEIKLEDLRKGALNPALRTYDGRLE